MAQVQVQLERNDVMLYFPEDHRQLVFDRDQVSVIDLLPCNIQPNSLRRVLKQ